MLKTIPKFENYAVTEDGQVWSKRKYKWLKSSNNGQGYSQVILCKNGKMFSRKIHTLVLISYVGLRPAKKECRHLDGNKQNNNLYNLRWGTRSENQKDSVKHGTHRHGNPRGEQQGRAKLTESDVRMIIYIYRTGLFTQPEIAAVYDVSQSHISMIVTRRQWKHIWKG